MEIIGKITHAFPEVSGVSGNSRAWKKREYVLQTMESRPRSVFFDFFGDLADQYPLVVGQEARLHFDIESREWQGKWFTQVRGWKADQLAAAPPRRARHNRNSLTRPSLRRSLSKPTTPDSSTHRWPATRRERPR